MEGGLWIHSIAVDNAFHIIIVGLAAQRGIETCLWSDDPCVQPKYGRMRMWIRVWQVLGHVEFRITHGHDAEEYGVSLMFIGNSL